MAEKIARKPLGRFIILAVVLLMMMGASLTTLYGLTIKNGDYYTENAEKEATNTIVTRGRRGTIYDCNGLVLAYDETCYNVCFMRDGDNRSDYDSAVYTEALIEAIKIINEGGSETIDTSYIRKNEKGELYYDWGSENERTIKSRYKNFCNVCGFVIPKKYEDDITKWISAEDAYLKLREMWFIPERNCRLKTP